MKEGCRDGRKKAKESNGWMQRATSKFVGGVCAAMMRVQCETLNTKSEKVIIVTIHFDDWFIRSILDFKHQGGQYSKCWKIALKYAN